MEERCRGAGGEREHRRNRRRSTSPDRAKAPAPAPPPMKKVQVFYYLSRNGRLEQPHFVEISLFPNQPLRLKDVMDRLTVLRGKAMPSLYSWSCKRNYKSGYVWNDLSENDVVYPAEGAEYVLKGSELVDACSEKLQQIHMSNNKKRQPVQGPNLPSKTRKQQLTPSPLRELDDHPDSDLDYDEVEDYEYDDVEKPIYTTTSTTPHSRCSRGVSTEEPAGPTHTPTESTRFDSSRLSTSKRFSYEEDEDKDEVETESSAPSRNSVLLQLIACGGSAGSKGKSGPGVKERLGRGVVCKMAGKRMGEEEMIKYMSENPRFGKLQTEEKEYFSGSIVESIREEDGHVVEPVLKKSTSYNEEKRKRGGELGEKRDEDDEDEEKREEDNGYGGIIKGRCIPRMISAASASASSKQPKKA